MVLIECILKLGFGHAISDLALQNQWIGKHKHPSYPIHYPDGSPYYAWRWVLIGHAMINGAVVWLITGHIWLGVVETLLHFVIDLLTIMGFYRLAVDQLLHGFSKVLLAVLWVWLGDPKGSLF